MERYQSKSVYVKMLDCGALPASGVKELETGITGTGVNIIHVAVRIRNGDARAMLPLLGAYTAKGWVGVSGTKLQFTVTEDLSEWNALATLKYTKD